MRTFEVHCTVEETKLYDVLTMLEPLATEIVSVPIKSKSKALVATSAPVIDFHPKKGKRGPRMKLMLDYMRGHPTFTRDEIGAFLQKKGVISRADPVLARFVEEGLIKRTGPGAYEVVNG